MRLWHVSVMVASVVGFTACGVKAYELRRQPGPSEARGSRAYGYLTLVALPSSMTVHGPSATE